MLHFPDVLRVRLNFALDGNWLSLHIITVCLDEQGVLRPGCLSVVSDSPLLVEFLAGNDLEFVSKVFLDKTTRILYESDFLLILLCAETSRLHVGAGLSH